MSTFWGRETKKPKNKIHSWGKKGDFLRDFGGILAMKKLKLYWTHTYLYIR